MIKTSIIFSTKLFVDHFKNKTYAYFFITLVIIFVDSCSSMNSCSILFYFGNPRVNRENVNEKNHDYVKSLAETNTILQNITASHTYCYQIISLKNYTFTCDVDAASKKK